MLRKGVEQALPFSTLLESLHGDAGLVGGALQQAGMSRGIAIGEGGVLFGQFGLHGLSLMGRQFGQVFSGDRVLGRHQGVDSFALFTFERFGAAFAQGLLIGVHIAAFMQHKGAF